MPIYKLNMASGIFIRYLLNFYDDCVIVSTVHDPVYMIGIPSRFI